MMLVGDAARSSTPAPEGWWFASIRCTSRAAVQVEAVRYCDVTTLTSAFLTRKGSWKAEVEAKVRNPITRSATGAILFDGGCLVAPRATKHSN